MSESFEPNYTTVLVRIASALETLAQKSSHATPAPAPVSGEEEAWGDFQRRLILTPRGTSAEIIEDAFRGTFRRLSRPAVDVEAVMREAYHEKTDQPGDTDRWLSYGVVRRVLQRHATAQPKVDEAELWRKIQVAAADAILRGVPIGDFIVRVLRDEGLLPKEGA